MLLQEEAGNERVGGTGEGDSFEVFIDPETGLHGIAYRTFPRTA